MDPIKEAMILADDLKRAEQPYLIAHKVRGEAAFDVAIKMQVEGYDEPWWIIPTSGHRAYPYWSVTLDEFRSGSFCGKSPIMENPMQFCPTGHPDHTDFRDRAPRKITSINLEELDL